MRLQPNSKGALVGLVLVLLAQVVLRLLGQGGFSLPVLAGFGFAAACLVVYSELQAGRREGPPGAAPEDPRRKG